MAKVQTKINDFIFIGSDDMPLPISMEEAQIHWANALYKSPAAGNLYFSPEEAAKAIAIQALGISAAHLSDPEYSEYETIRQFAAWAHCQYCIIRDDVLQHIQESS